jgi:hypothetical protein
MPSRFKRFAILLAPALSFSSSKIVLILAAKIAFSWARFDEGRSHHP